MSIFLELMDRMEKMEWNHANYSNLRDEIKQMADEGKLSPDQFSDATQKMEIMYNVYAIRESNTTYTYSSFIIDLINACANNDVVDSSDILRDAYLKANAKSFLDAIRLMQSTVTMLYGTNGENLYKNLKQISSGGDSLSKIESMQFYSFVDDLVREGVLSPIHRASL